MLRSSPIYKLEVRLRAVHDDMVPPRLFGSRTVLLRGLLNLVSNALKFTSKGHVTVHTSLLSVPDARTQRVRIDVVDTVCGMGEREMVEARQPYVRGRFNGRSTGLGLGLPIVIACIDRAGGKFQMDSTPGLGTRC